MDHFEPPIECAELVSWARLRGDAASAEKAAAILAQMEQSLQALDHLGWTLQAAHLSRAVESVRGMVAFSALHAGGA